MDRFQQKRYSHGREKPGKMEGALGEERSFPGNAQIKRRMGYSSGSSIPTEKNSFAFELKQSSSKQVNVAPMKLLLAEEMSKEMEIRRRSPSVIAKLMGLDALPAQQPVHKQQKVSDICFQRMESVRYREKYRSQGEHSFQKSRIEQHQFKDVFEVMETSNADKHNSGPVQKGMGSSKLSDMKMDFIRKKFMDAKRLSTNENLRQSKEFHDALEALNSNKDLLLKFLQEPDSLFSKHLHNLQAAPTSPRPSHIRVLKSSKASKNESSDEFCKSQGKIEGRVQMQKNSRNSLQKHEKGCVSHNRQTVCLADRSLKSPHEGKANTCLLPTRIVVLKPNLWKQQNMERSVLSPRSSASSHSRHREIKSGNRATVSESRDRSKLDNNVEISRSKRSREIAREITRKMRQSVSSGSTNVSTSVMKGYAGDESSCSMSGKDSTNDSEASSPTSSNFYGWNKMFKLSSLSSTESSVSREAKKRLSERLKTTHMFQEVELTNRGSSTLREMLALPDKETELMTLDSATSVTSQTCSGDWSTGREAVERWGYPSGISSMDGWKDGSPRNLTRSRSLPASSSLDRRPRTSIRHKTHCKDDSFMLTEIINPGPDRAFEEGFFIKKEKSSPRNIKFRSKRSQSFLHEGPKNNTTIREIHVSPKELMNKLEDRDKSEQRPIVSKSSGGGIGCTMQLANGIAVAESEDVIFPSKTEEEQLLKPTDHIILVKDYATSDQTDLIMEETSLGDPVVVSHCHGTEPDSPQSSKEAEQPSPVSVLEPPFEDISSSSDCFGSVSADLQGLRMQLQLLKLESTDTFTEGSEFNITSDEDFREVSSGLSEDKEDFSGIFTEENNREYSYLIDVLIDSGFHGADCKWLNGKLCSWEMPVGLVVFENLEKKYGRLTAWPRTERRLLFDRINSALVEILGPYMDLHPWVKLKGGRAGVAWGSESLLEETWQFLVKCGKEENGEMPEKFLGCEVRWLAMGDDVDGICRETERLLINDLIEELVHELSFSIEM